MKPKIVLTKVTEVEPDEEGAVTFDVIGTLGKTPFAFTIGISPEEGGVWDLLSGDLDEKEGPEIVGKVFSHPVVKKAIERSLA